MDVLMSTSSGLRTLSLGKASQLLLMSKSTAVTLLAKTLVPDLIQISWSCFVKSFKVGLALKQAFCFNDRSHGWRILIPEDDGIR
ncbi:hypothetical protein C5167_015936 [Papaver somniferum]|nr:hypothetical protein C5167_015936 [Papaver somniferum]